MLALVLCLTRAAAGAEVTDIPEQWDVRASLAYRTVSEQGALEEGGEMVGDRRYTRHDVVVSALFAPLSWAAVGVDVVTTPAQRWSFPDARPMVYDPAIDAGTMLLDDTTAPVVRRSAGVSGVWLGASLAPWSVDRGHRSSWRFDVGVRLAAGDRTLWTANDAGLRGAAAGGSAIRLGAAFSRPSGPVTPTLRATWTHQTAARVPVVDELGRDWGRQKIKPPSTVQVATGLEVPLSAATAPVAWTLGGWLGADYRTSGVVPSGVLLPSVLDQARTAPALVDEQVAGTAGLGLRVATDLGEVALGLDGRLGTPYRVEHLYDVATTAGTWSMGGFLRVSTALGVKRVVE